MASEHNPKISVITPSLNTGKYLRDTIESVLAQTFQDFEFIVVDGGSTDGTIDILKEYPRIRWISEKETDKNKVLEAFRKAFAMSRGDYIIQCCVSDGFLSKSWFAACNDCLDENHDVSLVWGLPQWMGENGSLEKVWHHEFLKKSPPQKQDFFIYWLAYQQGFAESNYCVRRRVYDECFPPRNKTEPFNLVSHYEFLYEFHARGYLSYFLPIVASFGRVHPNQAGERLADVSDKEGKIYAKLRKEYKKNVLKGRITHYFRNGSSEIIGEIKKSDLARIRLELVKYYMKYQIGKILKKAQEQLMPYYQKI